jgi:hypothetical protein
LSERLRRIIAWWQIVCGTLGLIVLGGSFLNVVPNSRIWVEQTLGWINYYAGIGFFSLIIAAGRALLKHEVWGLWASFGCQAVQVVSFATRQGPWVHIGAGPLLGVRISDTQFTVSAGFNASFFVGTLLSGPKFMVTINVIVLAWAVLLFREATRARVVRPAA